ncbi:hypothetical protein [Allorhodopirellula solitaria]|uniref:Lipoprotein n=1 Tax=Allorhodopirellula solitaria TaxID=2527987 RepID=A0A5C5X181_9BACT|nr:hypothetical protein [Allorhodopirellula solitaria]TWT55972.1 hypothetical protein CA85_46800 [Allorhodopirellula solitaria]
MRSTITLTASLLALTLSGCMSFSSTALNRFDDNTFSAESNGQEKIFGQARPFKGIPITLKVPTHLDIYVDETYFVKLSAETATEPLEGKARLLSIRPEVVKSDKVFIVDFKRPGSGTLDVKMTFDQDEQYFKSITSSLEDTTITDTAELVSTVIKQFGAFSVSTGAEQSTVDALKAKGIYRDSRVVAYKRFDINSQTFEQDVECFVETHLNSCDRCGTRPDYDQTVDLR